MYYPSFTNDQSEAQQAAIQRPSTACPPGNVCVDDLWMTSPSPLLASRGSWILLRHERYLLFWLVLFLCVQFKRWMLDDCDVIGNLFSVLFALFSKTHLRWPRWAVIQEMYVLVTKEEIMYFWFRRWSGWPRESRFEVIEAIGVVMSYDLFFHLKIILSWSWNNRSLWQQSPRLVHVLTSLLQILLESKNNFRRRVQKKALLFCVHHNHKYINLIALQFLLTAAMNKITDHEVW